MAAVERNEFREMTEEEVHDRVARQAYFRAEQRGFAPGYDIEDWVEAEKEVKHLLRTDEPEAFDAALET